MATRRTKTQKPAPSRPSIFPPRPRGMKGRSAEVNTLARTILATRPTRIALVGSGGSGKSMLATALGHRLHTAFGGRVDWFRSARWGFYTLSEMLALRFGTGRGDGRVKRLQKFLARGPQRLIVLDNHENDAAVERLFETFADSQASFIITARRCLLAGVVVFPVVAPLVTAGKSAFPRVASLTRLLRFNPLALDIADAIVASGRASATTLGDALRKAGVERVVAIGHEGDLPAVARLVDWAWRRLSPDSRRMLGVLAHVEGDHMDTTSLATLARVSLRGRERALGALVAFRLVQEPVADRYALHAVVRHAVARRTKSAPERCFEHYVS